MGELEAIDYLEPGMFTNNYSYVYGPLIHMLQDVGYDETNLAGLICFLYIDISSYLFNSFNFFFIKICSCNF